MPLKKRPDTKRTDRKDVKGGSSKQSRNASKSNRVSSKPAKSELVLRSSGDEGPSANELVKRFSSFPEVNPMPVVEADLRGKILYMNPAAKKLFPDLSTAGIKHPFLAEMPSALIEIKQGRKEWVRRQVKAEGKWYVQTICKVENGTRVRIYSADITDAVTVRQALQASERQFRSLYAESPIGIELYDQDGRLVDANKACLDIFGVSDVTEVRGFNLFADPSLSAGDKKKLKEGRTVRYEGPFDFERVKEHKLYPTNKSGVMYLDVIITPLVTAGEVAQGGYLVQVQDITERTCAEEALRESKKNLETHVKERTVELECANLALQQEITDRKRAEEAVKAEQRRFNNVLETLPAYLVLLTPDYHTLFANRFFRERFGESYGKRCYEYLFDRSQPCEDCETYKVLKTNQSHRWEWTGPDGRNYDIYDFPFTDSDGSSLILEMGIDITQQKLAQEELKRHRDHLEDLIKERTKDLQESEERYRTLFETMTEGFALDEIILDQDGKPYDLRYLAVNPAFETQTGLKAGDIIGRTTRELFPNAEPIWFERFGRVVRTGEAMHFEERFGPLGRWFEVSVFKVNERRFATVFKDITGRKQADLKIKEKEEELTALYENAPLIMLLVDSERRVRKANKMAEDFTGRSATDMLSLRSGEALRCVYSLDDPRGCGFGPHCQDCTVRDVVISTFETGHSYHQIEASLSLTSTGNTRNATFLLSTSKLEVRGEPLVLATLQDITERKEIEKALSESEKRLNRAQEIAHLGSWELDLITNRLSWSDEVYRIFGLKPQEFAATYEAFLEAVHPDDRQAVDSAYSGSVREGRDSYEIEHRVVRKSTGEVRIVREKCEHIRDNSGQVIRSIGMVSDITEWKQAEANLLKEKTFTDMLIDTLPGIFYVVDEEGRFLRWNKNFEQVSGYSSAEMSMIHPLDLFEGADRDLIAERIQEVLVKGQSTAEAKLTSKDGSKTPYFFSGDLLVLDRKRCVIGMGIDIGELMAAEEQLRQTRDYLENLFNYANAPIICWDANFKITRFNHAFEHLTDYKAEEVLGKDLSMLFPPESRKESLDKIRRTLSGEYWEVVEIPVRRKDGDIRLALWNSANVYAEDGKTLLATIAQGQDITERKRTEEEIRALNEHLQQHEAELAAANKELEAFSYSVSHDLRAPLRNINGFSQALLEDYSSKLDDKGKDYLERVRAATQRMGGLIDDLLQLSLTMRKEMKRETVDLSHLAQSIVHELKEAEPQRQVEVSIKEKVLVSGDSRLLRQCLENLLGNAWKFTSHRSPARIEFGQVVKDGEKLFFVKDNGAGFDMKYANKLFIPFQRLHSASEFSGNGIGLAMVKRIIERHGGSIWAEGETEKGATFYFKLQ